MQSRQAGMQASTSARTGDGSPPRDHPVVKLLGAAAFVLLAVGLCVRALLNEDRSVLIGQLVTSPQEAMSASLMVRHVVHLVVAGGIGLGALWIVLSGRRWRLGGLETGALVLVAAGLLSVPAASDKRLALNMAIDTILPLMAAAVLCQLLTDRLVWRRALLAAIVAVAAANCWKATAQRGWEYKEGLQHYQQNRTAFWLQQGIALDDPRVAAYEASQKTARPTGFVQGANVLSSFLLLGLAGTAAALTACGWWARGGTTERGNRKEPGESPPRVDPEKTKAVAGPSQEINIWSRRLTFCLAAIGTTALAFLALWHLVALSWVQTAGSTVGLLAALFAGVAAMRLRGQPRRLAILLAGGLILLQSALVVLAMAPADLQRTFLGYRGAGNKIRTLGARLCYYDAAIRLFAANPWTGVGPSQFGKHYPAVRPAYSDEMPVDAHNWLLNTAAEWGILGVLGVLVTVGLSGWSILQALAWPPDESSQRAGPTLLQTMLVVLGCWLVVVFELDRSQWATVLPYSIAVSLAAGALASSCRLRSGAGHVILLAGLAGLVVHCTAEITPSVPAVMWPFWALVALAMAWKGSSPAGSTSKGTVQRHIMQAGPLLAGAAAVAVVILTVQPMRAVVLMHAAQREAVAQRPDQAVKLLQAAAAADTLDPLPLKTAAFLCYRLGRADPARAAEHFRDYVVLSQAAVQRNLQDHAFWRSLALAKMYLASQIGDFALVDAAVRDMRMALDRNPMWPEGWLELARMAAVAGSEGTEQAARLRIAIEATDKALELQGIRAKEGLGSPAAQDRTELLQLREQLLRRLKLAGN